MKTHRVCIVFALTAAPLLTGVPAAHAEAFFQVETSAAAVHVTVTQQPASSIITASLLDDAVAYAASGYDSGGSSEALAAPAFPGNLVVQGPQLLCTQLFSCPVSPPNYPLLADASYPRQRHATADLSGRPMGSGPFIVTPVSATARASANSNAARTEAGSADLLAGTAGAVSVGASSATTAVHRTGRRAVATVSATASDVSIGGLVHIASVRAVDRVTAQPGRSPIAHPTITVAGVTVAGHAATIDDRGVHVAGEGTDDLGKRIAQHGLTIRTIGTQHRRTHHGSRSQAVGLRVDVTLPVNGVPYIPNPLPPLPPPLDQIPALPGVNANGTYIAHVTIGAVGAATGVGIEPAVNIGNNATPEAGTSAGSRSATGSAAPVGGDDFVDKLATPAPASPPSIASRSPGVLQGFVDRISKEQMETLYAVLALGSLTLFIGWRAAAFVRAGRSR